ncbi:hypothetical protein NA56DRAFT_708212 [Hyaloscypha hepaticicola]|uniref:Uncharacterized protein n=1 Tax=Hyaloscypha hepaticicola TaxID=2082293 RepID=A0A2J6PSJ5_9HELO|nr:hypothetical protein NA56DRAFT_708212 [Hyaloscypha hepaticicola]
MGGINYSDTDQPFLFRTFMHGFNLNLMTTRNILKSSGNTLSGFEFQDIGTEQDRRASMKSVKVIQKKRNWIHLVNLVDSVVAVPISAMPLPPQQASAIAPAHDLIRFPKGLTMWQQLGIA